MGRAAAVYPRVGGGTSQQRRQGLRSIPAWAGEPYLDCQAVVAMVRVYPRVGGGTTGPNTIPNSSCGLSPRGRGNRRYGHRRSLAMQGLSPRGRGNPGCSHDRSTSRGSIPAWAGEPWGSYLRPPSMRVYPRVGGGTGHNVDDNTPGNGLSPRGRGNPLQTGRLPPRKWSIPAWAGEPDYRRR